MNFGLTILSNASYLRHPSYKCYRYDINDSLAHSHFPHINNGLRRHAPLLLHSGISMNSWCGRYGVPKTPGIEYRPLIIMCRVYAMAMVRNANAYPKTAWGPVKDSVINGDEYICEWFCHMHAFAILFWSRAYRRDYVDEYTVGQFIFKFSTLKWNDIWASVRNCKLLNNFDKCANLLYMQAMLIL